MLDPILGALSQEGVPFIAFGALIAGVVRGFAGFGTAMIFLPFAAQYLSPIGAITVLAFMDVIGPLPLVPRAVREVDGPDFKRLIIGLCIGLPIGLMVLNAVSPELFRYTVSIVSIVLLIVLVSGFRYQGVVRPPLVYGIGTLGGFLGGSCGVPGPPVILFYMASPHPPNVIRATSMLYLLVYDILICLVFWGQGVLLFETVLLGILMIVPMMIGNLIGAWLFDPRYQKVYRFVAYAVIALSALRGLPIWD